MLNDLELLHQYAAEGSEDAFRTVLDRHLGLVYSAAARQVHDPHLAEEVTQAVFVVLARKAGSLRANTMLVGWLFRTTRFVAARAMRDRQLRQVREQEAAQMQILQGSQHCEASWDEVAPVLDEALLRLGETDRHAVLMRFFEKKELKEVGHVLGSSEEGARKRVSRALDKLRTYLVRRGITLSTATLAGALAENSVHAAPAALSASTFAAVTSNTGTATTLALVQGTLKAMFYAKVQATALATTLLIGLVGGGFALVFRNATTTRVATATRFYPISLEHPQGRALASYAPDNPWSSVPTGAQVFGGVPFQIITKLQLHANIEAKDQRFYPQRITGIAVNQRLGRLHVFNGANIPDHEGSPMAALRLNYADGSTHTLQFTYAFNTREWWRNPGGTNYNVFDTNTAIVWTGQSVDSQKRGPGHWHRLYRTTFELPHRDSPVETIDIFSLFYNSSLVVLAMTGESPDGIARTVAPSIDDGQFRRSVNITTTDRAGNIVRGAQIRGFALKRGRAFALGKLDDAFGQSGEIPVDFPTATRELRLMISSTNSGVAELNVHSSPNGDFGSNVIVRLEPGVRIGGYVRDSEDLPLENAKVEMFRGVRNSWGELLLAKYGEAKADATGRWRIREVPPLTDGMLFRVTLAGFANGEFEFSGDSATLTRDALLASRAEFKLAPSVKRSRQSAQPESLVPVTLYPERIPVPSPRVQEAYEASRGGNVTRLKEILDEHPEYLNQFVAQNTDTLLHSAAYNVQLEVVEELLHRKAEVNVRNTKGATPLHACASKGTEKIATLLLEAGADVTLSNNAGFTPIEWAAQRNRPEMEKFLREHVARKSAAK